MEVSCGFDVVDTSARKSMDNTEEPLKGPSSLSQTISKGLRILTLCSAAIARNLRSLLKAFSLWIRPIVISQRCSIRPLIFTVVESSSHWGGGVPASNLRSEGMGMLAIVVAVGRRNNGINC